MFSSQVSSCGEQTRIASPKAASRSRYRAWSRPTLMPTTFSIPASRPIRPVDRVTPEWPVSNSHTPMSTLAHTCANHW